MANTTAQLILEVGTREPTQRLGFGLRLGNAPESPAPTTVTYRYPVICDCVLFSTGTQSMNFITMLSKFTYGYIYSAGYMSTTALQHALVYTILKPDAMRRPKTRFALWRDRDARAKRGATRRFVLWSHQAARAAELTAAYVRKNRSPG